MPTHFSHELCPPFPEVSGRVSPHGRKQTKLHCGRGFRFGDWLVGLVGLVGPLFISILAIPLQSENEVPQIANCPVLPRTGMCLGVGATVGQNKVMLRHEIIHLAVSERARERMDERVAQYLHLNSCLFQTTVERLSRRLADAYWMNYADKFIQFSELA